MDYNIPMIHTPAPVPLGQSNAILYHFFVLSYISLTFGPDGARTLFRAIFKVHLALNTIQYDPNTHSFFAVILGIALGTVTSIPFDYNTTIIRSGSVVPQPLWCPRSTTVRQRHVMEANLEPPTWFRSLNGMVGVPLMQVLSGNLARLLVGANDAVSIGGRSSIHICVAWQGYEARKYQIGLRSHSRPPHAITHARFVGAVGRALSKYLDECSHRSSTSLPQWRIGQGGIMPNEVVMVGMLHVSAGTLQLVLQLESRVVGS